MNGVGGLGKALARNGGKPVGGILTSNPSPQVVSEILALGGAGGDPQDRVAQGTRE